MWNKSLQFFKVCFLRLFNFFKAMGEFIHERLHRLRLWLRSVLPYFVVFSLICTLTFVFFWPQIVITVYSGQGGVLYKRFFGTVIDKVYPEGLHLIYPWDSLYIYDVRIQTVLHDFDVLTQQGLPVHLSLAIRFRPEYEMLGLLHQQVGPDYVTTIIIPQVESVLRKRLSKHTPEEIYVNKNNILTKVVTEALEELGRKYVRANDVIIRNVVLPTSIQEAIEAKLVEEQNEQRYDFLIKRERKEATRKEIEAQGIRSYQAIVSTTLSDQLIKWQGVQATLELAKSNNTKVVVIGAGENGLPIILGNDHSSSPPEKSPPLKVEEKKKSKPKNKAK